MDMYRFFLYMFLVTLFKKWNVLNSLQIKKKQPLFDVIPISYCVKRKRIRDRNRNIQTQLRNFFNNTRKKVTTKGYNKVIEENTYYNKNTNKNYINNRRIKRRKKKKNYRKYINKLYKYLYVNYPTYRKANSNIKKTKTFLFEEKENEIENENEEKELDPELYENLAGCFENDIKNCFFDSLIDSNEEDYYVNKETFNENDESEEKKRKKYFTYGKPMKDKDFYSEYINKYYQHLPIFLENDHIGSNKQLRKLYNSNKIENLERNLREEDLYYPSVPVKWKVYVGFFFDKKYKYENDEESKKIYKKFNINIRHKFILEFLSWVRLSTRIYQNTSKVLILFNLKKNNNIYGNLFFFTSINLHYATLFMKSNPYFQLGLCEELYLYSYEKNVDHFLVENFPNLFIQNNYIIIKFFRSNKLKDINELYEKHMRFYITSNRIFKLGTLKKVPKDNIKDIFLSTKQYLPITELQTKKVLQKFDEEFQLFDKCNHVELNEKGEIKNIKYKEEMKEKKHSEKKHSEKKHSEKETENNIKFDKTSLGELSIINCEDEEEALEFLEKDPYIRSCLCDGIFFSEIREVSPHIKYSEAHMPKSISLKNYKYKLNEDLKNSEDLQDTPHYTENKYMGEKKLNNYEKVDFDILDTFIKLKYTGKSLLLEDSTDEIRREKSEEDKNVREIKKVKEIGVKKDSEKMKEKEKENENENEKMNVTKKMKNKEKRKYQVKIVDYNNDYIDYLINVKHNKIKYVKKKEQVEKKKDPKNKEQINIFDILCKDAKNVHIEKDKDVLLIDNTLEFFDHIFFKDYLSNFVYISLPPGEYIEDADNIKDEKNFDFTVFNNSLTSKEDFLKRRNFQPRFLKGIWLKKECSKILFYDKQNNALLFGTGIDKTFSWEKKVKPEIMKRALINMEIAYEKLRKGSSVIHDDVTIHHESDRTMKEYADDYTSIQNRFTAGYNQMNDSYGYKDLKPPPGLEYLNPYIWEKTPTSHKKLLADPIKVQEIHSEYLKKLNLYKATIDDDPFVQKVPDEQEILKNSDKVDIEIL